MGKMRKTQVQKFWAHVNASGECWLWNGATHKKGGHGKFCIGKDGEFKTVLAHRYAYELLVSPIPKGMVLDHLCRITRCVKPSHLEVVTAGENSRRAHDYHKTIGNPFSGSVSLEACRRGHVFTPETTYRFKSGHKYCKTCCLLRSKLRRTK